MELKNYYAQDNTGNILPSAICHLYLAGTDTPAPGLADANGSPLSNPFRAHADGLVQFAAPNGRYDLHISQGGHVKRLRIQCNDVTGNALKSELADPSQGAAMVAYGDGTVADKLEELSAGGGGLFAGLPYYEVIATDREIRSESFALAGIYFVENHSGTSGDSTRVFVNYETLHPRAFITGLDPLAIYGSYGEETFLVAILAANDVWSLDLAAQVLGRGAGSLVHDPYYVLGSNISIGNEISPGHTFIVRNNEEHPSVTVTLPSAAYGEVGFEYHIISDTDEPVLLAYEDSTVISTSNGYAPQLRSRHSVATLKKITPDKWIAFGDLRPVEVVA